MTDEPREEGDRPAGTPPDRTLGARPRHVTGGAIASGADDAEPNFVSSDGARGIQAFPVVGIGASAGGIEALRRFFEAMPPDSGCAFVVVLHLDPTRQSEMARVLASQTPMPTAEVEDGMRLQPDHVYVIAPDSDLEIVGGGLRVGKPTAPRGQRHPVDVLFASLAKDRREGAIAIVLSGTGSNGTVGLKEIMAEGGMSLVQDPETAKFDGMPRSAIAAGVADRVLAPEKMPDVLMRFVRHGYVSAPAHIAGGPPGSAATLDRVLEFLRVRAGADFRSYRKSTLSRRVHRRIGLKNLASLDQYLAELRTNPDEVLTLAGDLMISVTGFFRDPEAWQTLTETAIAPLVAERASGAPIRCWAPASATGEEAYSLAMLITETAEAAGKRFDLKVFATDAQEESLQRAREGSYPEAAVANFPPARLRRFFEKRGDSWRVTNELRDLVIIAPHNLLRDPPFSRLDIISCRNFLIYLEPRAQEKVVGLLHFALHQGGILLLGNAETVGHHDDLFEAVSTKWRIYRRIGPTRHDLVEYPPAREVGDAPRPDEPAHAPREPGASAGELTRRALLAHYAPASALIDQKNRVLYFHGTTRDFLEHPPGEPTRDLPSMVRDGLAVRLRAAIREAREEKKTRTVSAQIRENGTLRPVKMTVMPLGAAAPDGGDLLLVSFAPARSAPRSTATSTPGKGKAGHATSGEETLQEELKATRAELQNTIEHLETANEELKAANEEATSMNEELQSTNEEVESSKEELQSFNEELNTINTQLQHKITELESATNDLNNLLAGSDTATLFLENDLRIKWFSPATQKLFDFVASDIGRSISHFARKFTDDNLLSDAATVLERLITIETEVPGEAGRWYLRRMLPYRTEDNRIAGVVITFNEITERRHAAEALSEALVYADAILMTMRQPLLVLGGDLRVRFANAAFYELFRAAAEHTEGRRVYELGNGQWDIPRLRILLEAVISNEEEIRNFEIEHDFPDLGRRGMLLNARKLAGSGGRDDLILLAIEDITERRDAEKHREVLIAELNHRVKNVLATVQAIAAQTLRDARSIDHARTAFGARLVALGRAHDLLTRQSWSGADLGEIVCGTVEPHAGGISGGISGGRSRFRIAGPRLRLVPNAALSMAMALQELATNAAKYGALSTPDGKVAIAWQLDGQGQGRRLTLRWTESGGPPVVQPKHKGFGSRLLQRALAMELGGKVSVSYESTGVVCTIDAPTPEGLREGHDGDEREGTTDPHC
ncbi:MAG: chemotaxis protein CheB [Acetobacteraceae bacterium]